MKRAEHAAEPDLITSVVAWVAREGTLRIDQLQKMEKDLRSTFGSRRYCTVHYVIGQQAITRSERNAMIQEAWMASVPTDKIRRRFKLSGRSIRRICAGLPRQLSL